MESLGCVVSKLSIFQASPSTKCVKYCTQALAHPHASLLPDLADFIHTPVCTINNVYIVLNYQNTWAEGVFGTNRCRSA
jgi:hypothetical protein